MGRPRWRSRWLCEGGESVCVCVCVVIFDDGVLLVDGDVAYGYPDV